MGSAVPSASPFRAGVPACELPREAAGPRAPAFWGLSGHSEIGSLLSVIDFPPVSLCPAAAALQARGAAEAVSEQSGPGLSNPSVPSCPPCSFVTGSWSEMDRGFELNAL